MEEYADRIDILLIIGFILFEFYFVSRAEKRETDKPVKSIQRSQTVFMTRAIIEPWKTRYYWGGIVQLILFFSTIIHASFF